MVENKYSHRDFNPEMTEEIKSKYLSHDNYTYKSDLLFDEALDAADFVEYVDNLIPLKFRQKHGLGKIHQLGLAVDDVKDAIPKLEDRGVGPLLFSDNVPVFWYECGESKKVRLMSGTGYHHGIEIEPLGPAEGSDIYKESVDPDGRPILHHVAFSVSRVDDWASYFIDEGFPIVLRGRIAIGPLYVDFAYMDTAKELGLLVEFCSYSIFGWVFKPPPGGFHLLGRLQKVFRCLDIKAKRSS